MINKGNIYDAINRVTEIHRPISEYHYTYDDRGFITGKDVVESLYAYAWDDKHDGKDNQSEKQ